MARDGYTAQTSPGGSSAYSGASPQSFGAAIGAGLADAGDAVGRIEARRKERNKDEEAAAAGLELAEIQSELDTAAIDARQNAAPGGAGHSETVGKFADERIATALGKLKNPDVKRAFEGQYARLRGTVHGREYAWEAGERVAKLATDFDKTGTTLANGIQSSRDPDGLQISLDTIEASGRLLSVGKDTQDKLIREQQRKVVSSYANATADVDPKLLLGDPATKQKGLLDDPRFTRYLEPEDIEQLRNGAKVEIRRQEAAERQKLELGKADAREDISVFLKRVAAGEQPDAAEFKKYKDLAKQYDLEGPEFDLTNAEAKIGVNRETRDWTPAQFDGEINRLRQKGDKRTGDEDIRLKQLEDIRGPRESLFRSDPWGWSSNNGRPVPEIDWDNPNAGQVQRRVAAARALQQSTGLTFTPYLTPNEEEQLKGQLADGPVQQVNVASRLRGVFGVAPSAEIVRRLAPGNKELELLVGLPPLTAQTYKRGLDVVKMNGKLIDEGRAAEIWNEYKSAIPGDLQPAVFGMARAIAGAVASDAGHVDLQDKDAFDGIFRAAINRAGGALGGGEASSGGFPTWRGRRIWLPQDMTAAEAQRRISRATPDQWTKAGDGDPYYRIPSGRLVKLPPDQIRHLRDYSLETVNPGVYVPTLNGKPLVDANGETWTFDIRKLK